MELLRKLILETAPSGREKSIATVIKNSISQYVDEIYEDNMGNLIAHKKGDGKKIMFAAHMDEIGVVVTFIDEKGFLRFADVGGLYTKYLAGRRVKFSNGTVGVIGTEPNNDKNALSKMYIDIGAKTFDDANKLVNVGDMAVFMGDFIDNGDVIISKALDDRAGCYVLVEAIKQAKQGNNLYFAFTAEEEVGLRGARTAAFQIEPEYAIVVDVTDTGDTPESDKISVKFDGGAAIKVMDYSVICDKNVRDNLEELAKENKIPYQFEVMTDGGTDAGVIHFSRGGVKTGGISIPTRYIHSPSEMISKKDLEAVIKLAVAFENN